MTKIVDKQIDEYSPILPISVVADLLGIHMRTLMLYEYHKLLVPHRSPSNRRMYSQHDVVQIQFIRYLTRKKKINYAGIRTILSMLEVSEKKGVNLRSIIFSDFKTTIPQFLS